MLSQRLNNLIMVGGMYSRWWSAAIPTNQAAQSPVRTASAQAVRSTSSSRSESRMP
jgi:hypothetical protein